MGIGSKYDNIIGCAKKVSVSISCSRYSSLASFSTSPHVYDSLDFMDYMLFSHELLVYIV